MDQKPKREMIIPVQPIPSLYFNGFEIKVSPADITVNIIQDRRIIGELKMSFTTAKTFAKKLSDAMVFLDSMLEHPIYTIDEVNQRLAKKGGSDDPSRSQ